MSLEIEEAKRSEFDLCFQLGVGRQDGGEFGQFSNTASDAGRDAKSNSCEESVDGTQLVTDSRALEEQ